MRSRLNFRGQRYLAEREPWIDYADPPEKHTTKTV
jgi:hypothetical protein